MLYKTMFYVWERRLAQGIANDTIQGIRRSPRRWIFAEIDGILCTPTHPSLSALRKRSSQPSIRRN